MKKVLVGMVTLMAVILPLSALGAEYSSQVGTVGKVKPSPLYQRRIEIDADKMKFQGNGSWWLRDNLAAMLRNRARNSELVEIAVTGRQFRDITDSQDRIHLSGRYSRESREQVPLGEMVAPTDQYRVTGIANISRRGGDVNFRISRQRINLSETEVTATVTLIIEPVDIRTGLSSGGYEAFGEVTKRVNFNASASGFRGSGSGRTSKQNVEAELLQEAAEKAVDDFIRQFSPEPLMPAAPAHPVTAKLAPFKAYKAQVVPR